MAIERAEESSETEEVYPESETMETETTFEPETTVIPATMLAEKKVSPGDVVRLEVVSVSDEDGTITVKYASGAPAGSAIDQAAKAFKSEREMM